MNHHCTAPGALLLGDPFVRQLSDDYEVNPYLVDKQSSGADQTDSNSGTASANTSENVNLSGEANLHLGTSLDGLVQSFAEQRIAPPGSSTSPSSLGQEPGSPAGTDGPLLQKKEKIEQPPAGCAPDAVKLFAGNIPKHLTKAKLVAFFESAGKVVELIIMREKATCISKGSAFIWYERRQEAEQAIALFHQRGVMQDSNGMPHPLPLVVRKANPRAKDGVKEKALYSRGEAQLHVRGPIQGQNFTLTHDQELAPFVNKNLQHFPMAGNQEMLTQNFPLEQEALGALQSSSTNNTLYNVQQQLLQLQAPSMHGHIATSHGIPGGNQIMYPGQHLYYDMETAAPEAGNLPSNMGPNRASQLPFILQDPSLNIALVANNPAMAPDSISSSLMFDAPRIPEVCNNMHAVEAFSRAKLCLSPTQTPGIFCLVIMGVPTQVQMARELFQSVLRTKGLVQY